MNSIMNTTEVEKQIEKITIYKRTESILFDKIKTNFKDIKNYYTSKNQENIDETVFELEKKLKIIETNHNTLIEILNRNVINYKSTAQKVANSFNDITLQ